MNNDPNHRVTIATPSGTGRPRDRFVQSLIRIYAEISQVAAVTHAFYTSACVYNGRWELLRVALRNGSSHILFLDDDMTGNPEDALCLLRALLESDWTGVSGLCILRGETARLAASFTSPEGEIDDYDALPDLATFAAQQPIAVHGFGCGWCMFDLQRVTTALHAWARAEENQDWNPDDPRMNPFLPMRYSNGVLGEDLSFCRRLRAGGARLAIHPASMPDHVFEMPLNMELYLRQRQHLREHGIRPRNHAQLV